MLRVTGIHHVALSVRDLERSVEWYQRVLGLEVAFREPGTERQAAVLVFPGTAVGVGLVQHGAAGSGGGFDPAVTGLDHAAFGVASRDELDAWLQHLDAEGVAHSGAIDVPPGAIANFKDPDGIALSFFWDRPIKTA